MRRIASAILLTSLPLTGYAQLYKCSHPDGSSVFQDTECPTGATGTKLATWAGTSAQSITLYADNLGHFHTRLSINRVAVDGMIDTGASMVTLSMATAHDMGIELTDGKTGLFQTANGIASSYIKSMPVVKIGSIDIYNVDVSILPRTPTLIGMNALKHFKINEENGQLILTKQW